MAGSSGNSGKDIDDVDAASCDPFEQISQLVLSVIEKRGGKLLFCDLENWAESTQIGKYTLRTIVNDLIESGRLSAPEGFLKGNDDFEPAVPKMLEIPTVPYRDICMMKRYLCEYWSVGELRLFDDMGRMGMKGINEVLKAIFSGGYASLTPSSVVNATEKLLREAKLGKGTAL